MTLEHIQTYRGRKALWYYQFDLERMRLDLAKRQKINALHQLKKQKLLKLREKAGIFEAALTQKGLFEYVRLQLHFAATLPEDTDCLVVFDIPESLRPLRLQWRRFLSSIGFIPIQQSVWASNFDIAKPLSQLIKMAGAGDWIRVYIAKQSD